MISVTDPTDGDSKQDIEYGDPVLGVWRCAECGYECYPRRLRDANAQPPFQCSDCRHELHYDIEV